MKTLQRYFLCAVILFGAAPLTAQNKFRGCPSGDENPQIAPAGKQVELLLLVNEFRVKKGLLPLKRNNALTLAASYHAQDMGQDGYFDHFSYDCKDRDPLDGRPPRCRPACDPGERIQAFYNGETVGENIGYRYPDAPEMMNAWTKSRGHNKTMRREAIREAGVGYFDEGLRNQAYWVLNVGARRNVYPVIINLDALRTPHRQVTLHAYRPNENYREIRLRNAGEDWRAWQPYPRKGELSWQLSPGAGRKRVQVQLRNGDGELYEAEDIIQLE